MNPPCQQVPPTAPTQLKAISDKPLHRLEEEWQATRFNSAEQLTTGVQMETKLKGIPIARNLLAKSSEYRTTNEQQQQQQQQQPAVPAGTSNCA
eukprot:CAMPEP_0179871462 /NCGR_PEP_ID=MMETSP0982-20121206/20920_1 /TAXON_ID=483367 /ORGANISM="non described non described, Strain CCMP 2436" /LENGTH=93 /DNA_ID=CAMNT_0021762297 /DNA_START=915 /DNA_END=1197 /DNA_ORIENTATION=+